MLQNKFNETQSHLFSCLSVEFFFQLWKLRRSLIRLKKTQQNTAKKLPWNLSIKKIKCNLYAVRLLSPIGPHRCPVYMYFVKF